MPIEQRDERVALERQHAPVNPGQKQPATPWEAEIDALMRRQ